MKYRSCSHSLSNVRVVRIVVLMTLLTGIGFVACYYNFSRSAASTAQLAVESTLSESDKATITDRYGQLQLSFESNQGQTDPHVKFVSRGSGYDLFLTADGAVLTFHKPRMPSSDKFKLLTQTSEPTTQGQLSSVLRLTMIGANH